MTSTSTTTSNPTLIDSTGFGMDSNPFAEEHSEEAIIQKSNDDEIHRVVEGITREPQVPKAATHRQQQQQQDDAPTSPKITPPNNINNRSVTPGISPPASPVAPRTAQFHQELQSIKEEGNKLFLQKKYQEAIAKYQRAMEISGTIFKGHRELLIDNETVKAALSEDELNILKEKLHWYTMKDIKPDHPELQSMLSKDQIDKLREALETCESDLKESNQFRLALIGNTAQCYIRLHQYQNGIRACDAALELDSKCIKAYMRRSKCYEAIGDYDSARKDIDTMMEIDPHSKAVKDCLRNFNKEMANQKRKERNSFKGILKASKSEVKRATKKMKKSSDTQQGSSTSSLRRLASYALGFGAAAALGFVAFRWYRNRKSQ